MNKNSDLTKKGKSRGCYDEDSRKMKIVQRMRNHKNRLVRHGIMSEEEYDKTYLMIMSKDLEMHRLGTIIFRDAKLKFKALKSVKYG
jgi:hypothetical protein